MSIGTVLAGTIYQWDCSVCGRRTTVAFDEGIIVGFCLPCRQVVKVCEAELVSAGTNSATMATSTSQQSRSSVVWDQVRGSPLRVFSCPKCTKSVLEIRNEDISKVSSEVLRMVLDASEQTDIRTNEVLLSRLVEIANRTVEGKVACFYCTNLSVTAKRIVVYDKAKESERGQR